MKLMNKGKEFSLSWILFVYDNGVFDNDYYFFDKDTCQKEKNLLQ